ncbi:type II toxin-antitoxin system VapC family toxin [Nonomuraea sp. PA05]|nr:type II toxin-antitoxin system VapC family toxin [Nonomuraea sp. PA05]
MRWWASWSSRTPHQARIARRAYQTYGKGNNSKGKLNMGNCIAYALDQPLLFQRRGLPAH